MKILILLSQHGISKEYALELMLGTWWKKRITPVINTGIAHKKAGLGQIGAGTVHPPIECLKKQF